MAKDRAQHCRWLSMAAAMRRDGQKKFAKKLVNEAKWNRWCPYHQQFDALKVIP